MTLKARKRWAIFVLLVVLPAWVVAVVSAVNWAEARWGALPFLAELAAYVGLGLIWILPFRRIFTGVGRDG